MLNFSPSLIKPARWPLQPHLTAAPELWRDQGVGGIVLPLWEGSGNPYNIQRGAFHSLQNGASWTVGSAGPGISFDGSNDYIDVGNLDGWIGAVTGYISCSIVLQTTQTSPAWIFGVRDKTDDNRFDLRINVSYTSTEKTGALLLDWKDNSGNGKTFLFGVDVDTGITDGDVHKIDIVANPFTAEASIAVDGVGVTTSVEDSTFSSGWSTFNKSLFIGGFNDGGSPLSPFNGTIYGFRLTASSADGRYRDPFAMLRPGPQAIPLLFGDAGGAVVTSPVEQTVSQITETETAPAVSASSAVAQEVGQVVENETATAITGATNMAQTVSQAIEFELALSLPGAETPSAGRVALSLHVGL